MTRREARNNVIAFPVRGSVMHNGVAIHLRQRPDGSVDWSFSKPIGPINFEGSARSVAEARAEAMRQIDILPPNQETE